MYSFITISKNRLRRLSFRALRIGVILYLALCFIMYFATDWLLFPGAAYQGKPDAIVHPPIGAELIHITTTSGDKLTALFGRAKLPNGELDANSDHRPTLVYFYGNGAMMAWSLPEFEQFRKLDVNVLMPDYAGYGMSSGKPSETSLYATADAAYDYLTHDRAIPPTSIISTGWSLGAAVAIDLASRRPVGGLAVFNAFTGLHDMAHNLLPWLPSCLVKYEFNSQKKIARIPCPIFICNGALDTLVPPAMSDRLAAAAKGPVTRLVVPAADHNDIFAASPQAVFGAMAKFLAQCASDNQ